MLLLAFTLAWLSLLFVVARLADSRPSWRRFSEHPFVYVMSLGVYATSWTFFGGVGFARTHGVSFVAVSLGPTLACLLIPSVFLPLLRLVRRHQLATVADLFAFRYRSQALGVAVTIAMLVGVLPYLAVQVRAVATTATTLVPTLDGRAVGFAFCAVMLVFATLFGARHATTRERHPGLVLAIAFESAFKTLALLAVGVVAWSLDVTPTPERVEAFLEPARTGSFGSVLLLAVSAAFLLPRQFHMAFTEAPEGARGEQALKAATWGFPLLLLVMNLPIPLVLWAGEALAPLGNGDLYVLLVADRVPWLGPLVWLGGASASSAMVIVASLALSSMSLTHLVLPWRDGGADDVYGALVRSRRVVVALLMLATFLVFLALEGGDSASAVRGGGLAQVGLVSFSAVLQLVPGLAGVLFLRRLSGAGVLAGLVAGLVTWGVLLALPVVGFGGLALPAWLAGGDALGVSALSSLVLNVVVATVVSSALPASQVELRAGQLCADEVDSLTPGRLPVSMEDLVARVSRVLGQAAARVEVERVAAELQVGREAVDAATLQRVAERVEQNLSGLLGPLLAHAALTSAGDDSEVPLSTRLRLLEDEARRGGADAAHALREWLSNVFASLPVGVCVVTASGEPVWWNATWKALSGAPTSTTLAQWPAQGGELTLGERALNLGVADVTDARLPGGRVLVLEDLTARRALERTVAHQERLASIGRLGAGIAHEIGNPLAGLLMTAETLARDDALADARPRLTAIIEQGKRIDDIVKALVTFARGEQRGTRQPRPLFLEAVVRDAVALVSMTKKRRIEVELDEGLGVRGVAGELVQVVVNLLANAADASPPDAPVKVVGKKLEHEVEVRVVDSGVGMTAEVQARLFEPFFTTKAPGEGTGLGMSIVYSLVQAHAGRVEVDSAPGRGTTVTLRLPGLGAQA